MIFACLYIPDFYAQAVARLDPELRGRALAVVETAPPPFRVFALNEAARRSGAESGMSRVEVAEIRGIEVRRRSVSAEISAHAALLDLARSFSPRFENYAIDTVTLDLAGLEALSGPPERIARRLHDSAQELGLEANVALAPNPDAARMAARGFAGVTLIGAGEESHRLGELPVTVLDPAPEVQETLERWGIRTFRALAALPSAELSERLGQEGIRLQRLARGAGLRSLVPAPEPLHFEEAMDLDYAIAELDPLAFILGRLLNQLCARLAVRGRATQEIRLILGVDGSGEVESRQLTVDSRESKVEKVDSRQLTVDSQQSKVESQKPGIHKNRESKAGIQNSCTVDCQLSTVNLFSPRVPKSESRTLRLPFPTCNARLLLKLWLLDLEARPPAAPVLKVAIAAEPVRPRVAQGDLFLPRAPDPQKLELTLARLKGVVGEDQAGSPELLDTHRPDALRMQRFVGSSLEFRKSKLESRNSKVVAKSKVESRRSKNETDYRQPTTDYRPSMALRLFRPPLAAQVELRDGRPVRVEARSSNGSAASGTTARGTVVRGDVTASAGPWRTSGDWWTEDPWEHDEWDVEVRSVVRRPLSVAGFNGRSPAERTGIIHLYRIYCDLIDGRWFLEGLYD